MNKPVIIVKAIVYEYYAGSYDQKRILYSSFDRNIYIPGDYFSDKSEEFNHL